MRFHAMQVNILQFGHGALYREQNIAFEIGSDDWIENYPPRALGPSAFRFRYGERERERDRRGRR